MVAAFDPSDGIEGRLVIKLTVAVDLVTATVPVPETEALAAVIVMTEPGAAEVGTTSVAVALPVESVVPWVTVTVPALAVIVTATPLTAAELASVAVTVI